MNTEAFRVSFEKTNYHRLLIGGDVATVLKAREQETRNNILRYLGEYRLAVKFDEFFYRKGISLTGEEFLATSEEEPVNQRFRKAIFQKEKEGKSSKREVAECLGFEKIENAFLQGEDFLFLWISPPGKKEDGYGDYSFTFVGEIKDNKIRVVPYRNKLSLAQHGEVASIFSKDTEKLKADVDFLANPIFIQKKELKNAEDILLRIGEKERIDLSWRSRLEAKIDSLTDMFMEKVKNNAPDWELERIKRTIENLTIDKKTEITRGGFSTFVFDAESLINNYGSFAPPKVAGSCGSSSSSTLMDFQSEFNLEPDKYGERTFPCPKCGKTNVRPKDELLSNCQHCGSSEVACQD